VMVFESFLTLAWYLSLFVDLLWYLSLLPLINLSFHIIFIDKYYLCVADQYLISQISQLVS
jgi:hypothetical protein